MTMPWQSVPYVFPLGIAAAISAVLALFAWRHRSESGAVPFAILMVAVAEWALAYALQLASADYEAKILFSNAAFMGVVVVPTAWMAFSLQYTGRGKWLMGRQVLLLTIIPLLTVLAIWTDGWHHLFRGPVVLDPDKPLGFDTTGIVYWAHAAYSYLMLVGGTFLLAQAFIRSSRLYRRQSAAMLVGALIPWVANAISISGLVPSLKVDLTPFAFTLTGLSMAWGLFRFRMLDVVPVARDTIIESMSDGVIVLDAKNRIVDINPAAQDILVCTASEAIGQSARQILAAWPRLVERYHDVAEAHVEIVIGEDSAQQYLDLRISPLHNWRNRLTGRLIVLRDITTQKRIEHQLEERRLYLESLLACAPDAIVTLGAQHHIIEWNAGAEKLFGYSSEKAVGKNIDDLISGRDVKTAEEASGLTRLVLSGRDISPIETIRYRKDGTPVNVILAGAPILVEDELAGVVAVYTDITARKQAEKELQEAKEIAEVANQAKSEFVSLVSHELRAPIGSILGSAGLLAAGSAGSINEEQAQFLDIIETNAHRMTALVSDLTDISRIEAGQLSLEFENVSVADVVNEVAHASQVQIKEKKQTLNLDIPPDISLVRGDRNRLIQVLTNLVNNAHKFTPRGGEIAIRAKCAENQPDSQETPRAVCITVEDNGIGINPQDQEKLFQKFFRSEDQQVRQVLGTGLGLSIAKNLVEMQGGHIWFESELHKGTTFHFTVPVAKAA